MLKSRLIIVVLALFLLLGTTSVVMGSTQNKTIIAPAQIQTAIIPPDGPYYNTPVCGTFQTDDGRSYVCVGLTDKVNGPYKTFVQISPLANTEAINMFTFLNSAYWSQKPVNRIEIYNGNITDVFEYNESVSVQN